MVEEGLNQLPYQETTITTPTGRHSNLIIFARKFNTGIRQSLDDKGAVLAGLGEKKLNLTVSHKIME